MTIEEHRIFERGWKAAEEEITRLRAEKAVIDAHLQTVMWQECIRLAAVNAELVRAAEAVVYGGPDPSNASLNGLAETLTKVRGEGWWLGK